MAKRKPVNSSSFGRRGDDTVQHIDDGRTYTEAAAAREEDDKAGRGRGDNLDTYLKMGRGSQGARKNKPKVRRDSGSSTPPKEYDPGADAEQQLG